MSFLTKIHAWDQMRRQREDQRQRVRLRGWLKAGRSFDLNRALDRALDSDAHVGFANVHEHASRRSRRRVTDHHEGIAASEDRSPLASVASATCRGILARALLGDGGRLRQAQAARRPVNV